MKVGDIFVVGGKEALRMSTSVLEQKKRPRVARLLTPNTQ